MIYLDNAATTFPKPESVYRAAEKAMRVYGGNPGRSSHRLSYQAGRAVYECREKIADMLGGKSENVVFTLNATYALNIAINSLKKPHGTILISSFEHNAVLRPVANYGHYDVFDASGCDDDIIRSFTQKLAKHPSLVVVTHQSNLCGAIMPVNRMGKLCSRMGIPFIIDASQSCGKVKLSLSESHASAICAPSHKGLYGIQGSGFIMFSDMYSEHASSLSTFIYGGNGVNSLESTMPDFLPERFEGGTLSTPSIMSLSAGITEVNTLGIDEIAYREENLSRYVKEGLSTVNGVELYGEKYGGGTLLFNLKNMSSEVLAEFLDRNGICVRGGYHCCPLGHITLKTPVGGAVRASFSPYNTRYDADRLLSAVNKISKNKASD